MKTLTGIDSLLEGRARGRVAISERIALATNPSAVTRRGVPTWKALMEGGYSIAAFFGPEHGFLGDAQDAVEVGDSSFRGIPSYSLYGIRQKPEASMLEGVDLVVYDIQDLGCRYYTYLYTLANIMSSCEAAGKKVLVLDRPDPIGGLEVEGGPISKEASTFVGGYGLPHRYGMTVGEFARYLKGEFFPRLELEVVELESWRRSDYFGDTGLPWVNPSPNVPTPATALVYPGTCLFEGTNLSEGRGTTRPFETIGSPWIDGEELREAMASMDLPGALFTRASFTPISSKHAGTLCGGVTVAVTDRAAYRPLFVGLALLKRIHDAYPGCFAWKAAWEGGDRYFVDSLAGGSALRLGMDSGKSLEELYAALCEGREAFLSLRKPYLLYR
jgi:uncharacterized protein YbbC (DUF1343 family)